MELDGINESHHVCKWVKDLKTCVYCGSNSHIHSDHVIARSKGGVSTVPACACCNQSKSAKPLMEWLHWVKKNNDKKWEQIVKHNFGKSNPVAKKVHTIIAKG